MSPRSLRLLLVLALGLGYMVAVLHHAITAATLLVLFWVECVLCMMAHALLGEVFWRRTGDKDQVGALRIGGVPLLTDYFLRFSLVAGGMVAFYGVFVFTFATLPIVGVGDDPEWLVDWGSVRHGAMLLGVVALLNLAVDISTVKTAPELGKQAVAFMLRTVGLHPILLFGMLLMSFFGPKAMLVTILLVKLLVDLRIAWGIELPTLERAAGQDQAPGP